MYKKACQEKTKKDCKKQSFFWKNNQILSAVSAVSEAPVLPSAFAVVTVYSVTPE
jgi:hypothetical protein